MKKGYVTNESISSLDPFENFTNFLLPAASRELIFTFSFSLSRIMFQIYQNKRIIDYILNEQFEKGKELTWNNLV